MRTQVNRPSRRHTDLNLQRLIERALLLGEQGRQTVTELKTIRGRVEASRAKAEQTLLRATLGLQRASERLSAIRAAAD